MSSQKLSESQIQRSILDYLRYHSCIKRVWRNNVGVMKKGSSFIRYGEAGISDIIGFTRVGTFFAVEVKRVKKKPTEGQKEFLALLKSTTLGQGLVAEDLADVVHWMNETIIPLVKSLNRA